MEAICNPGRTEANRGNGYNNCEEQWQALKNTITWAASIIIGRSMKQRHNNWVESVETTKARSILKNWRKKYNKSHTIDNRKQLDLANKLYRFGNGWADISAQHEIDCIF